MKRIATLLFAATLVMACGGEKSPPPGVTPGPVIEPTKVVVHEPCVGTGAANAYSGDCQPTDKCRDGNDGFYYGTCETVR